MCILRVGAYLKGLFEEGGRFEDLWYVTINLHGQ